jgi:transcriptional regulator with XRE-family HTH domain
VKHSDPETIMEKVRNLFDKSGKTLEDVGLAMGYTEGIARRAAWQFIKKSADPRISMLCRYAKAMGVEMKEIV